MLKHFKAILVLISPEQRLAALALLLMAVITILSIMKRD